MSLLPTALAYLERGYSVVCVGRDKKPLMLWKDYQDRLATPEELVEWWTKFPDAQIGIVTGAISNLTVVDIEADGNLDLLKDETYRVQTGSGGVHVYFQHDVAFKNAVRILPSVDIRSTGGYVVAAGSESLKGGYKALNGLRVAKMSSETRERLLGAVSGRSEQSVFAPQQTLYPRMDKIEGLEYVGYGEGMRNDMMTKFAGSIHAMLHSSLWNSIGLQLFRDANLKNTPPLPERELMATWESIGRLEQRNNPGGRIFHAKEKTWGPTTDVLSPDEDKLPEQALEEDSPRGTIDPKDTLHAAEVAALQVIDSDHTYKIDMPPFDDALLGGFSAGELIVVAGQSGHGKTSITQDWCATLASGGKELKEKLPVLWFSYEVLAKPLWDKFQSMGATLDTPIYMPRFNESGDTEWVVDVIERAIVKWNIRVVAVDHLGFLRPPKGNYANAADAVTHTVRALKQLAIKRGLIVMLPVHVRKTALKNPDLNDIRESLGIAQEADTVFFINREKDEFGQTTQEAKVWLVKNRKTGIAVSARFDWQFGRYYYVDNDHDNNFNDLNKESAAQNYSDF